MCDPISIGLAVSAASASAGATFAGLTIAGSAVAGTALAAGVAATTATSALQAAQSQKAQAKYQSQVAQQNATLASQQQDDLNKQAVIEGANTLQQVEQLKGSQKAAFAANNLDVNYGSPASVLESTEYFGGKQAEGKAQSTQLQGWQAGQQSQNELTSSKMYQTEASNIHPLEQAGVSLLSSASNYAIAGMNKPGTANVTKSGGGGIS